MDSWAVDRVGGFDDGGVGGCGGNGGFGAGLGLFSLFG